MGARFNNFPVESTANNESFSFYDYLFYNHILCNLVRWSDLSNFQLVETLKTSLSQKLTTKRRVLSHIREDHMNIGFVVYSSSLIFLGKSTRDYS